jgi:2-isopropylmalate synthase
MQHKVDIFDTTLRDGTQGEKISFSAKDKLRIARKLDQTGFDYIEGGWPGSNPTDMEFFEEVRGESFGHAKIVAFGSTCRAESKPGEDANIQALIEAATPAVSIFGKSWLLHVKDALQINPEENLDMIRRSVTYLKDHGKEVIYDAEHFFDGYTHDSDYALKTIKEAESAGADVLVLCDTNGGTLTSDITEIVSAARRQTDIKLGIHAHNDCELAVANTLAAVEAGCRHVQGTVNGYGERCGNANLCSVIPNLQLKQSYDCIPAKNLAEFTAVSRFVSELANVPPDNKLAFVGHSAFAHKGGIHVSAVMKNEATYEHIPPDSVGNKRRVLISDLSGKSNVSYKSEELGISLQEHGDNASDIVARVKQLENEGFRFEAAEASFELLIKRMGSDWKEYFDLDRARVIVQNDPDSQPRSEATIRLIVNGTVEHSVAEEVGPVHALDRAIRKALRKFYPQVDEMHLQDYKVRVLNGQDGTDALVRVLIDSGNAEDTWGTVGVSKNIIDASWQALSDSYTHFLTNHRNSKSSQKEDQYEMSA